VGAYSSISDPTLVAALFRSALGKLVKIQRDAAAEVGGVRAGGSRARACAFGWRGCGAALTAWVWLCMRGAVGGALTAAEGACCWCRTVAKLRHRQRRQCIVPFSPYCTPTELSIPTTPPPARFRRLTR
jgi:hypothetical protein